MTTREVPEPWASHMLRQRLTDPRNGRPSMTRLAEAADTHPSTISAMIFGTRQTSQDVIERVVKALFPDPKTHPRGRHHVNEWVGRALQEAEPFEPHPDADLLTVQERKAVNELIRLLAQSKKRGGRSHLRGLPSQVAALETAEGDAPPGEPEPDDA